MLHVYNVSADAQNVCLFGSQMFFKHQLIAIPPPQFLFPIL